MINLLTSLLAAAYGTVNDIEIVWTLVALFGFLFSLFNIREARRDLAAVKEDTHLKNDRRYILAILTLKAEVSRAIVQIIFFSVGIYAMTFPSTNLNHAPLKVVIFSALFTWGFIIAAMLISLNSYWNFKLRNDLRNSLEQEAEMNLLVAQATQTTTPDSAS